MPANPYKHFNDHKSACYMRLWELEGGDGDQTEVGIGFAGGGNWEDEDDTSDADTSDSFDSDEEDDLGDSDEEDDLGDFGADDDLIIFSDEEDDSSDDEPAPDQRPAQARDVRIEIVNFARAGGAANPRIFQNVRHAPLPPAPPPVPVPPRRARGGQRAVQQPEAGRANLLPLPGLAHGAPGVRAQAQVDARDLLDMNDADNEQAEIMRVGLEPARAMGLERFLELAQRDQEDEWDSDEWNEQI
jgi:E3 ubiquitin-protein ligase RNF14